MISLHLVVGFLDSYFRFQISVLKMDGGVYGEEMWMRGGKREINIYINKII